MTTRTITVNTPEETEVQICDECGLGEDAGELVEFLPDDPDLDADLHYHRDCAREKTGNPQTLSEAFHEAVGAEMEHEITFVLERMGFTLLQVATGFFLLGTSVAAFAPEAWVETEFAMVLAGLGAVGIMLILYIGRDNGQKTAEEMV